MNHYKEQANKIDEATWLRYESTKDVGLRNEILMSYLYIVTYNLKKSQVFLKNRDEAEDMASYGVLELINCIDRYDVGRGVQFDSFASIRLRGAIIDYIRKKDWVPSDLRKKTRLVNEMSQQMQNELGRPPCDNELAERLEISEAELTKIRVDEMSFNMVAFEEILLNGTMTLLDFNGDAATLTPEHKLLESDFKNQLSMYIEELNEKERLVVSLYYYEELKLKEIAFVMGVTLSRVSQIHSKAIAKLRQRVMGYLNE